MQRVPPRIKLLVSVRNVAEAKDAIDAGVDIIDIKEPSRGPLGRADAEIIESIARIMPADAVLSVALGELADADAPPSLSPVVSFAKTGLLNAPSNWEATLRATFGNWPRVRPVAVAYADQLDRNNHPSLQAVLDWAIANHVAGLLLDTTIKDGRSLFDFLDEMTIIRTLGATREAGIFLALAGSLRDDSFARALKLQPDIVAVRGAACISNHRQQSIDPARLRALLKLIEAHHAQTRPAPSHAD